jgi:glycerate dehydrogenase
MRPGRSDLTTLLAKSDVVSLHCPLTEHNYHLIGEKELALMKSDALLINAARGGLIDEQALLHALNTNQIAGAALDVLEREPPSINHPLSNYHADNLTITPHIAWASQQSRQKLVDEIAKNILGFQRGEPRNLVT